MMGSSSLPLVPEVDVRLKPNTPKTKHKIMDLQKTPKDTKQIPSNIQVLLRPSNTSLPSINSTRASNLVQPFARHSEDFGSLVNSPTLK